MKFVWKAQTTEGAAGRTQRRKEAATRTSEITVENADEHFCYIQHFKVLICRKHTTAIQNIDKHLRTKHRVTVAERRAIVEKYSTLWIKEPGEVALPTSIRRPFQVLGAPLDAFQCEYNDCTHITKNFPLLKAHFYQQHNVSWQGDTDRLFGKVKVQTFFNAGGLQRYFVVRVPDNEAGGSSAMEEKRAEVDTWLSEWKSTQERHEAEMQVMDAEVAKTDKTGWFTRTGWLQHFKKRNLKHLAHAIRLPGRDEGKLKLAARLVEVLVERSVAGLSTLGRETRRWLRSAQREEVDQRPMARLQNPESQATYAGYYIKFVCYILRIIADEQKRAGSESVNSNSSGSQTSSSDSSDSETGNSNTSTENRARHERDHMKDTRELFHWHGRQKELAEQLWAVLDEDDEKVQVNVLLQVLASFIFQHTENMLLESGLIHFLAVLGIDAQTNRLRTAKNYSYMLTGIVYCTRVIAAEAILPSGTRNQQISMD
jgi:hypothetical protein